MAGTFILGETKVRPGTYFNIQKKGGNAAAGVMNGVTAVIFRADFGPLNEAIELSAEDTSFKKCETSCLCCDPDMPLDSFEYDTEAYGGISKCASYSRKKETK